LVHAAVKTRLVQNVNFKVDVLLRKADDLLSRANFAAAGRFVACFSEVEDDLAQWRGYGGGECGYSIGFRHNGILEALLKRPGALLVPLSYQEDYEIFVDDVIRMAEAYFLNGINRGVVDVEKWAVEFLMAFSQEMDILAALMKHPKFADERERRITALLQTGEEGKMEFTQKRTLLARHLPIDLRIPIDGTTRLPLTRIYVGPGPSQGVSRISVGDLLLKFGYQGVPVKVSEVPYRVP
jgi:hypothetical protein